MMRQNENIIVTGDNVILVPYEDRHVLTYHQWMQCVELQQLTASEPLSLEEEYEMQKSWRQDEDKCTFIILDAELYKKTSDDVGSMIGDTNLFFQDEERSIAEIEIMIAEPDFRGKGRGKESLKLMMMYGVNELGIQEFTAKIGVKNTASIALFQNLGFDYVSTNEIFQEITFKRIIVNKTVDHELNYNLDSFESVWVSTDSCEIADIARTYGALVHHRPAELAHDTSSSIEAVQEFLSHHDEIQCLALLQCTSPFLQPSFLSEAYDKMASGHFDCVFAVRREHQLRWKVELENAFSTLRPLNFDPKNRPRRQDWEGELVECGMFYFATCQILKKGLFQSGKCGYVEIPKEYSLEIDSPFDWLLAETVATHYKYNLLI